MVEALRDRFKEHTLFQYSCSPTELLLFSLERVYSVFKKPYSFNNLGSIKWKKIDRRSDEIVPKLFPNLPKIIAKNPDFMFILLKNKFPNNLLYRSAKNRAL
jgi:hypothetical protein